VWHGIVSTGLREVKNLPLPKRAHVNGKETYFLRGGDSTNGCVYVTDSGSNTVSIVNPSSKTVVGTVTVGTGPEGETFENGYLYVANHGSGTVSVITPSAPISCLTSSTSSTTSAAASTSTTPEFPVGSLAVIALVVVAAVALLSRRFYASEPTRVS